MKRDPFKTERNARDLLHEAGIINRADHKAINLYIDLQQRVADEPQINFVNTVDYVRENNF
jgi:hypothetical protein